MCRTIWFSVSPPSTSYLDIQTDSRNLLFQDSVLIPNLSLLLLSQVRTIIPFFGSPPVADPGFLEVGL